MKLSETQRHQLELILRTLRSGASHPLSHEAMRELLGSQLFGEYLAIGSKKADSASRLEQTPVEMPKSIRSYRDRIGTIKRSYRTQMARLPKLRERKASLDAQIASLERQTESAHEDAWHQYEKVPARDRVWLANNNLDRPDPIWPPPVLEEPPFEACHPGVLSPVREAQILVIEKMLASADE